MGVILLGLLVTAAFAANTRQSFPQLEMDQAIPFDQYSVGYDCSSVRVSYIQAVCSLCQATVAYTVFHGETEYLTGLYAEQREMVGRAVDDVLVRLPVANYTIAFVDDTICIAGHQFEGRPNFQLLFSYFSRVQPQEIQVPELFNIRGKTELDYIAVRTKDTTEAYQYEGLTISYRADDTAEIGENVELSLEDMTVRVDGSSATLTYTGTALIDTIAAPFTLVVPYDREPRTPFSMGVIPLGQFTALEFTTLIDPISNCEEAVRIPGLSSQTSIPVDHIILTFAYRPENNVAELLQIAEFHQLPDFAVLPLMPLTSVYGQYVIDYQTHLCRALVDGNADYRYQLRVQAVADNEEWYVWGGIDQETITVQEIQDSFYTDYFMGLGQGILPQYDQNRNQEYVDTFRNLTLSQFSFRLSAETAPSLQCFGYTTWAGNSNTFAQVLVGWVNSEVESAVVLSVRGRDDFVTGDSSIVVVESRLVAATADIRLADFPYMRGIENQEVAMWPLGMTATARLAPGDTCDSSDFCSMLANNTASLAQFSLTGAVIGDQLNLRGPFPGVTLATNLTFVEAELVLDVSPTSNRLYVEGGFTLTAEDNSVLRFAGNITDSGGSAVLESRSELPWNSPMGQEWVGIGTLEARGFIKRESGLTNSSIRGPAVVGLRCLSDFNESRCALGTVDVSLSPSDYRFNSYTVRISGMELTKFMEVVVGLDINGGEDLPFALRGLDVSASLDLMYPAIGEEQGVSIVGPVNYYGVNGWMVATMDSVGSRAMDVYIDLDEFYMGNFNLWVRRSREGQVALSMLVDDSGRDMMAAVTGRMMFWGVESDFEMTVSEIGMRTVFQATPGLNFYRIDFSLQANATFTSLQEAELTLSGNIPVSQLATEQSAIRTDLEFWIRQGVEALDTLDAWKDNSTTLRAVVQSQICPSDFCPELVNCVTAPSVNCVVRLREQVCSQQKTACISPVTTCSRNASMCVSSTAKCITVDNSVCIDWITICDVEVDVCTEWTQECERNEERSCSTYEVRESPETCVEYEDTCTTNRYTDQGCLARCEQNLASFQSMSALSDQYREGYESAAPELLGFRSMFQQLSYEGYGSQLFELMSVDFELGLGEPGLGVQDFDYMMTFATLIASTDQEIERRERVTWSFVDRDLNELSMLRAVKRVLIENSNSTLSSLLVTRTPLEVALESLYPSSGP